MAQITCSCMLLIMTFLVNNFHLATYYGFTLVNADICLNTTFMAIVIFGQISTGSKDLVLIFVFLEAFKGGWISGIM